MSTTSRELLKKVRACRLCRDDLEPRPVLQMHPSARVLIASQAPGSKVHASGIPFDDPSGDRLRDWMGIDRQTFYDPTRVAIVPMGFCYPGRGKSGDLPPQPRCAETWREKLLGQLEGVDLTIVIGQYAIAWHLGKSKGKNLTQIVQSWRDYGDGLIPLPHPSPRNNIWLKKNPWFEATLVPELRARVSTALDNGD